jgi:hypothetical protein
VCVFCVSCVCVCVCVFLDLTAAGTKVIGAHSIEELARVLKKPRRVMLLVKAGKAVDDFIEMLVGLCARACACAWVWVCMCVFGDREMREME